MPNIIYRTNDNLLLALGVSTISPESEEVVYMNQDCIVEVTLRIDGALVGGDNWPVALVYIHGSRGDFQGNLRDTLSLPQSGIIVATLEIDNGTDQHALLTENLSIQTRRI